MQSINNISGIPYDSCMGCRACIDVCKKKCINLDGIGIFLYPKVSHEDCVNCGQCLKVCPTNTAAVPNGNARNIDSKFYYALAHHYSIWRWIMCEVVF